jgi:hypothetical protein
MLWVRLETGTYNIIGYNVHPSTTEGVYEFWVTKPTGKSVKIVDGNQFEINQIRLAMDEALRDGRFIVDLM